MGLNLRYDLNIADEAIDVWAPSGLDLSFAHRRLSMFASTNHARATRFEVRPRAPRILEEVQSGVTFGRDGSCTWIEGGGARLELEGEVVRAAVERERGGMALENALRFYLSRRLLEQQGVMVHAACLVGGFGAVIFPGVSGAGKSTVTMRHPKEERLAEDLVALRREGGRWFVHPLPFFAVNEIERAPGRQPVAGLAFPVKSRDVRARRLSPSEARPRVAQTMVSFAPIGLEEAMLERVLSLSRELPAVELELDRVSPIWSELALHFETPSMVSVGRG